MRVFILLAFAMVAVIAGLAGVFSLVHGRARGIDRLNPQTAMRQVGELPKFLEPERLPMEPAQPVNSGIHKCVQGGKTIYTDQPCKQGQSQHSLDPERSRIVTLPAVSGHVAPAPTASPAPDTATTLDLDANGNVRRSPP